MTTNIARPLILFLWLGGVVCGSLSAEQLFQLRNGMVLRGTMAEIASLKEGFGAASAGEIHVRPIWLIDDGLRRIYIHGNGMSEGAPIDVGDLERTIEFAQKKPLGGKIVAGLGNIQDISPFNEFGRRVLTIRGPQGPVHVVQGITELNSRFAKVIALKGRPNLVWDMRVATSSLDSATLKSIFRRRVNPDDLNARLEVVRFFIAAERYDDAKQALQQTITDFPNDAADLRPQLTALTERQGAQLLDEAETRADAGQYLLARGILNGFPMREVGRITRIQVEDALKKLDDSQNEAGALVKQLQAQVAQLNAAQAAALQPIIQEIADGLSADTLPRLSDYARLGKSDQLPLENRVALAVAGWLLGSGSGEQNLTVATSLVKVRDLVAKYLGPNDPLGREGILNELRNLEGAEPEYVDRMLPLLVPSHEWPDGSANEKIAGMFNVETKHGNYVMQLPPEYNPLREYPCIVALHEARGQPLQQIDWWAGDYNTSKEMRRGHATRHGFIVLAPQWSRPAQRKYEYTPREHERVMVAVRDAMRRCSIDADRVFIAGHGEGATAAWDIALAHPDLWAGMISISGSPDKTVPHYEPNSLHVPLYMVMGELDGNRADGSILNDYMSFKHDAMVVMYRGRGREYFYDEIHRLFEWMMLTVHSRRESPREIETVTMRHGDQFFWWLEIGDLKPGTAIDPILWDQAKRIRAAKVSASIGSGNQIRLVNGPSDSFRILLRPQEGIDLNQPVVIRYRSRAPERVEFDGSLDHMLEDVRQRADRKRPFWTSLSIP